MIAGSRAMWRGGAASGGLRRVAVAAVPLPGRLALGRIEATTAGRADAVERSAAQPGLHALSPEAHVGLAGSEAKLTAELSGGMKKRVGIARATVTDAELVIYDEPTAGLDPVTTQKIYDLMAADHARTGASVLAVSSDVTALACFVDEIALL